MFRNSIGHFESQDRLSYAVFLAPQSDPTGGARLLVFSKMLNGDGYAWKQLVHWGGKAYHSVVISTVPPGKYSDYEDARILVTTKLDGALVEYIEAGLLSIIGRLADTRQPEFPVNKLVNRRR
jgi:hypothetical protein